MGTNDFFCACIGRYLHSCQCLNIFSMRIFWVVDTLVVGYDSMFFIILIKRLLKNIRIIMSFFRFLLIPFLEDIRTMMTRIF